MEKGDLYLQQVDLYACRMYVNYIPDVLDKHNGAYTNRQVPADHIHIGWCRIRFGIAVARGRYAHNATDRERREVKSMNV